MEEKLILVDLNDKPIGETEKMEAHKKALLHRAVSVFIFNSERKMLLQKRALTKYHSPGLWTNTACTHPYPDEKNEDAVTRRLKQEMGLAVSDVRKLFDFTYKEKLDNDLTEYEFDHVFIGFSNEKPIPDTNEVMDFKYEDINEVLKQVKESPQNFTVWFKTIIERVANDVKNLV